MSNEIVIIGGGQSGAYAASSIIAQNKNIKIKIITEENYLPYERPPLSKQFIIYSQKLYLEFV